MGERGRAVVRVGTLVGGLVLALGSGLAVARQDTVSATDAWVSLPAGGDTTAVACVQVNNPTMYDLYLLSATTEVAEQVEFRRSDDEVVKELTVPAYGGLEMQPDGVHMVLTGLEHPLAEDERVSITLRTDGGPLTVSAVVRKP